MKKNVDESKHYYNNDLKEFEKYNTTTSNIYELGEYDVLIILNDGSNLTSYDSISNDEEVLFISENLEDCSNLSRKYNYPNVKAIVTKNFNENVLDISYMFYSCYNLSTIVGLDSWDVSKVQDMHALFKNCNLFDDLNSLKNWDVSSVRDMNSMFHDCSLLKSLDALESWNVSNVTDMSYMFENCSLLSSLNALKSWNNSSLIDMEAMFRDCNNLENINSLISFNTSNVENMTRLFENCSNLEDISPIINWDLTNVKSMKKIFNDCNGLIDSYGLSILDINQVSDLMDIIFSEDEYLEEKNPNCNNRRSDNGSTTVLNDYKNDGFFDFYYSDDLNIVMKVLDKTMNED